MHIQDDPASHFPGHQHPSQRASRMHAPGINYRLQQHSCSFRGCAQRPAGRGKTAEDFRGVPCAALIHSVRPWSHAAPCAGACLSPPQRLQLLRCSCSPCRPAPGRFASLKRACIGCCPARCARPHLLELCQSLARPGARELTSLGLVRARRPRARGTARAAGPHTFGLLQMTFGVFVSMMAFIWCAHKLEVPH